MLSKLANNKEFLDHACMIGATVTISLVVAGAVALLITQSGIFHPYCSPLIGIGLCSAAIPTAFITHLMGNILIGRERHEQD